MWPIYVIGAIALVPTVLACIVKNKIGKVILSFVGLLGFFGFSIFLSAVTLPSYVRAAGGWIPFVLCGAVFVAAMLIAWKPFSVKVRRIAAASIVGAAVIASAIPLVPAVYRNSLLVVQNEEVNLRSYLPFGDYWYVDGVLTHHESLVEVLDEDSTLKLSGELPRLDGATALYPLYSAFVRATYPAPEPALDIPEYEPFGALWRYAIEEERLIAEERHYDEDILIPAIPWELDIPLAACSRTSAAFKNLIDGYADIVFLMGVSDEQYAEAAERGLELVLTPVGREAFVFFVHSRNSINGLSSEDIRRIYSGEITNWSEAGGSDDYIRAYQRPEASGSQVMLRQIMGGVPIVPAPEEDIFDFMLGMVKQVARYRNYRNSLGYSFLYYARDMTGEHNIKFLSIDGIAPEDDSIASGAYPFASDFYAVIVRQGDEYLNPERAENIDKLLGWILSQQGQYLVEATGYVPVR